MSSKEDQDVLGNEGTELGGVTAEQAAEATDSVSDLAGRAVDVAVAEQIFGWQHAKFKHGAVFFFSPETLATDYMQQEGFEVVATGGEDNARHYSTDIAAAMEVLEQFDEWKIAKWSDMLPEQTYEIEITHRSRVFTEYAVTVSEGICRAALQSVSSLSGNNN